MEGSHRHKGSESTTMVAADESATEIIVADTIAFWQPLASHELTHEDVRQIRENMTGFFRLLLEWDAQGTHPDGDLSQSL